MQNLATSLSPSEGTKEERNYSSLALEETHKPCKPIYMDSNKMGFLQRGPEKLLFLLYFSVSYPSESK